MHTDENKMNFLRRLLNETPSMSLTQAFTILDAAVESFPATPAPESMREGVLFSGRYFSPAADKFMQENKKIAAIKEVRNDNRNTDGSYLGLRDAKEVVEARMAWMGWPYAEYRTQW